MIGRLMHLGGFKWFCKNGIYVKGYLFDRNNILYRNDKLVEYFDGIKSEKECRYSLYFFFFSCVTAQVITENKVLKAPLVLSGYSAIANK
jgi:hypothetical protein